MKMFHYIADTTLNSESHRFRTISGGYIRALQRERMKNQFPHDAGVWKCYEGFRSTVVG